jgi:hypothetical protein
MMPTRHNLYPEIKRKSSDNTMWHPRVRNVGYKDSYWHWSKGTPKNKLPILWDGHPARPWWLAGNSSRTTRNFWVFF